MLMEIRTLLIIFQMKKMKGKQLQEIKDKPYWGLRGSWATERCPPILQLQSRHVLCRQDSRHLNTCRDLTCSHIEASFPLSLLDSKDCRHCALFAVCSLPPLQASPVPQEESMNS